MVGWLGLAILITIGMPPATPSEAILQSQLPSSGLMVIENIGQFDSQARFLIESPAGRLWLNEDSIWIQQIDFLSTEGSDLSKSDHSAYVPSPVTGVNIRLTFSGALPSPEIIPFDPLPVHMSYFKGSVENWKTDLPIWGGVRYKNIYPGVDLVMDNQSENMSGSPLQWRLEIEPGADLSTLQLSLEGADSVTYEQDRLHVWTAHSDFDLPSLISSETAVSANLEHKSSTQSVTLMPDDQGVINIGIDFLISSEIMNFNTPTSASNLDYSTYLGGSMLETATDIAIDSSGAAYITGRMTSIDFPTTPGPFSIPNGDFDAFISKLSTNGSTLVYSCIIGGISVDKSYAIDVSGGFAEIAGETLSTDFPVTAGAYDTLCGTDTGGTCNSGGQGPYYDAFFVRVNETCTDMNYSTYLGGGKDDFAYSLRKENGNSYLAGGTESSDFPGQGFVGEMDAFVTKFNSSGELVFARSIGGRDIDVAFSLDLLAGSAYIAGETSSTDFPATGYSGGRDGFVVKLDPNGSPVSTYSKYLGGSFDDRANSIIVGSGGESYVTGWTNSSNFPATEGSYHGGIYDAFLIKLSNSASIAYGTYLGGAGMDEARGVTLDQLGGIYLIGRTNSVNFPATMDAYQGENQGGDSDAFVVRYDLASSFPAHISYATYLGGQAEEAAYAISIDANAHVFLTGFTKSSNFPITSGGYDLSLNSQDAFIVRMLAGPIPSIDVKKFTNGSDADLPPGPYLLAGSTVNWTYVVTNNGRTSLSGISVSDNKGVSVSCPKTSLQINESMTCTASSPALLGQYSNIGTATGIAPTGVSVSDTDASNYFGANPGIKLVKKTNGQDANSPPGVYILSGAAVNWAYELTNTGNVSLSDLVIKDDNGTPSTQTDDVVVCIVTSLGVGASQSCTRTGQATPGQYANNGVVTAKPPEALAIVSSTDISHYFGVDARNQFRDENKWRDRQTGARSFHSGWKPRPMDL